MYVKAVAVVGTAVYIPQAGLHVSPSTDTWLFVCSPCTAEHVTVTVADPSPVTDRTASATLNCVSLTPYGMTASWVSPTGNPYGSVTRFCESIVIRRSFCGIGKPVVGSI